MNPPPTHILDVACVNCGETHRLRSTSDSINVDICSYCHPAYTGVTRAAVLGDRVERFNRRLARAAR